MRTNPLLALLAALIVLGAAACSRDERVARAADPVDPMVAAVAAKAIAVDRTVEIVGTLAGHDEVQVSAQVAGPVVAIRADLGDVVRKGQVLLSIDSRELALNDERAEAALSQAESMLGLTPADRAAPDYEQRVRSSVNNAEYQDAKRYLERARELSKEGVLSHQELDVAEARFNRAAEQLGSLRAQVLERRADWNLSRKRLADAEVRTPIDGSVGQRKVEIGEFVKEHSVVFAIVANHPLKFQGAAAERVLPVIAVGQPVRVRLDAFPDRQFDGTVSRVSPAVDPQTRTFAIEATVPNPGGALKAGSFAAATIVTARNQPAVAVPRDAVVELAGLTKVFVVQDSVARARLVKRGREADGWIEIDDGVRQGDLVAVTNLAALADGVKVRVKS